MKYVVVRRALNNLRVLMILLLVISFTGCILGSEPEVIPSPITTTLETTTFGDIFPFEKEAHDRDIAMGSIENQLEKHSTHHGIPLEFQALENPIQTNEQSIAAGKEIYQRTCFMCHGASGRGNGPLAYYISAPPKDVSHTPEMHNAGELFYMLTEGKNGTPMLGFKNILTEEERWRVIIYIQTILSRSQ